MLTGTDKASQMKHPIQKVRKGWRYKTFSTKLFFCLWLVLLVSCSANLVQAPLPDLGNDTSNNDGQAIPVELSTIEKPLVANYFRIIERPDDGKLVQTVAAHDFKYQPRQSNFEGFENWDILSTPWPWAAPKNNNWLYLNLNRDVTLTVLVPKWAKAATWVNSWQKSTTKGLNEKGKQVDYQAFSKTFPKGELTLPAMQELEYTLLLAEADGSPSAEPALPDGVTERPVANQTCPAWLANSWVAKGPDDRLYKTWQPQIDPVYWCYYRHDHGSDPSLVGYTPAFDYVAYYNNQQNEKHEGFKGFAFKEGNVGWYINVHATTGLLSRTCVRFHTVVFFAKDLKTDETLLELSYKGDFGSLVSNQNEKQVLQPKLENCDNQQAIAAETKARKTVRVFQGAKDPGNYERWRGGTSRYLGMDFPNWSTGMTVDIRNPATGCSNANCTVEALTGENASKRTLNFTELSFTYNSLLDKSDGKAADGYFYTDAYGKVQDDDALNTVRQFIKPGFTALLDGHYASQDAWRGLYIKDSRVSDTELEDALGKMN